MTIPGSKAAKPTRGSNLSGSGGLTHRGYDDGAWNATDAMQTYLVGSHVSDGTTHGTLKQVLDAILAKTKRVRTLTSASPGAPVISPAGDDTTGVSLGGGNGWLVALGQAVVAWTATAVTVSRNFSVTTGAIAPDSARVFLQGLKQEASTGAFLRIDATAGEVIWASSRRALKMNEVVVTDGLNLIRPIQAKRYDLRSAADGDRVEGHTHGILGFIAEDLAEAHPALALFDAEGAPSGVQLEGIVAALVAAVQDLDRRIGDV